MGPDFIHDFDVVAKHRSIRKPNRSVIFPSRISWKKYLKPSHSGKQVIIFFINKNYSKYIVICQLSIWRRFSNYVLSITKLISKIDISIRSTWGNSNHVWTSRKKGRKAWHSNKWLGSGNYQKSTKLHKTTVVWHVALFDMGFSGSKIGCN